ncbi:uncharacterized protein FRV6_01098 [Fusarium oxysporum]|uniref:Uncharacterized protein n=1 Tax=Fusarium oxysporum TaxID=5507 RepID=A0A2H3SKC3_FUSOX|nr:uncharacterized protein FRV6_01098 [Fusarium oxysporum]
MDTDEEEEEDIALAHLSTYKGEPARRR